MLRVMYWNWGHSGHQPVHNASNDLLFHNCFVKPYAYFWGCKVKEFRALTKINCMQSNAIIKKGWLRVLLFLIAYFLVTIFGATMVGVIAVFLFPNPGALNLFYTTILLSFFVGLLLVLFFRKTFDRQSFISLGFVWKGFGKERASVLLRAFYWSVQWQLFYGWWNCYNGLQLM